MRRTRPIRLAVVALLVLVAGACGDDDDDGGAESADTTAGAEDTTTDDGGDTDDDGAGDDATAEGDGEPIRIGLLTSFNGPFAPWGVQVRDGMQLAVDEINEAGGVDGRMLEIAEADDQSNAEEGVAGFERLVEDGVVAIGGTISSDVGLATAELAEELETPLFLVKAGSDAILTADSRYTFRTCLPAAPMVAGPIAQYAEEEGLTNVGAIIADYAWGQAVRAALESEFDALDGVSLQVETAPVGEQDFTTYLRALEESSPELIVATGHPPGSGPITVQSADLGLDVPVTGAYSVLSAVMEGVGDAGVGRYADFDCADYESDSYQQLARRYLEMSDNTFMDDDAVAGFGIVTMVADAVAEVGDDPVAVAEYLHGETFDLEGYAFEMGWTDWGELATAQPVFTVIGEGPAPEGVNDAGDWYPETLIVPEPLPPYEPS
ncbi:MAG: ABC transporter substrate-binding protein [Actinomycetota bacterium]|nr:ABC transporter substrate-binding protein [Actinomycetota bacterium]